MVKIVSEFAEPKTQDGQTVNLAPQAQEADPRAFQIIVPDFYPAILHEIKSKKYMAKWGDKKNPDAASKGLWEYHALTPDVELLNADTNDGVNSRITRQDVTLGVLFRGQWYRPDGDTSQSPFFKDATNLLSAVSMFRQGGGVVEIDGDTDHIIDRPVKVRIAHAGYVAGKNINLTPKQLTETFAKLNGDDASYTSEDLGRLIEEYNYQAGYVDANGEQLEFITVDREGKELDEPTPVRLKLKNHIVGWYFPSNIDIRVNGWYTHEGKVFLSEAHAERFEMLVAAQAAGGDEQF